MIIHFSGLRNIDNPGILAFPKVLVCLDCGFSQFTISNTELALLASPTATGDRQPFPKDRVWDVAFRVWHDSLSNRVPNSNGGTGISNRRHVGTAAR